MVFDVGNVLIRWDPRNVYRLMGFDDAATKAVMAETRLPEINHRQLDAGAPFGETIARLAEEFPHHSEFILAFDARWTQMLDGAIEPSVSAFDMLKKNGFPVHAISNFNREKFDIARGMFPFLDNFDELVVSGDVGMVKPDEEIFQLLIERSKLEPGRTVFIDDSADNIATASLMGFETILFIPDETDLHTELAHLGV